MNLTISLSKSLLVWLALSLLLLLLAACNGESSSDSDGVLQVAITDAEDAFLTYAVDVTRIDLERADGTRVSVLSNNTRIDFVQYQELSEFFNILTVPGGFYSRINLVLDFSEAEIIAQKEADGMALEVNPIDVNGAELTEYVTAISLEEPLWIRPGVPASLTIDFDLGASNTVDESAQTVTVEPVLLAEGELDSERELRVRGVLAVSEPDLEGFTVAIRPFRFRLGDYGQIDVLTADTTQFDINGVSYQGSEGLLTLQSLPLETPVVSYGLFLREDRQYHAAKVLAGSSVPWDGKDLLRGVVTARDGNSLTLSGAVLEPKAQRALFQREIQVTLDELTQVGGWRRDDQGLTLDDVSVGSRIQALGQYSADSGLGFDASGETIQLKQNQLSGEVVATEPLTLALNSVNGRKLEGFDFTGTGATTDSDPMAFVVETGNLALDGLASQTWLRARGYFGQFGADGADFVADSLIQPGLAARYKATWWNGVAASLSVDDSGWQLGADSGRSQLKIKGIPASHTQQWPVTALVGKGSGEGVFAVIRRGEGIEVFRDFASYSEAVADYLAEQWQPRHLTASGQYDEAGQQLQLNSCALVLM